MKSLEFIKQHVTEWPRECWKAVQLSDAGVVVFYTSKAPPSYDTLNLSEHFSPDYYDGKVYTREEFESFGVEHNAPPEQPVKFEDSVTSSNKYEREISDRQGNSAIVDVYDVLKAFDVTCPATQHALKKLLCTGIRGHKDVDTDLIEARESITRAIELRG